MKGSLREKGERHNGLNLEELTKLLCAIIEVLHPAAERWISNVPMWNRTIVGCQEISSANCKCSYIWRQPSGHGFCKQKTRQRTKLVRIVPRWRMETSLYGKVEESNGGSGANVKLLVWQEQKLNNSINSSASIYCNFWG